MSSLPQPRKPDQPPVQPIHCEPVALEGVELLGDPNFKDVAHEVADRIQAEELAALYANYSDEMPEESAAARAALTKKCAPCIGNTTCPVKEILDRKVLIEQKRAKLQMFKEAPVELTLARLSMAGIDYADFLRYTETPESTQVVVDQGKLNLDALLAGITNKRIKGGVRREDLPELKGVGGIEGGTFDAYEITIDDTGQKFLYIDCPIKYTGPRPNATSYGVLLRNSSNG